MLCNVRTDSPMPTKLDLAVIAALLAGGLVFLEASHRIDLASPAAAEPAPEPDVCASANLHYAVNRLTFFEGGYVSGVRPRQLAADALPPGCLR
jgi:hypothetical protein